jgi:hypothetical protein
MMNKSSIGKILEVCRRIKNSRDLNSIFGHASGEMHELREEVDSYLNYLPEGLDGVTGEAIDVILCMVDIIYMYNDSITEEALDGIICRKLEKWERLYSNT